jgi:hypothetical protein
MVDEIRGQMGLVAKTKTDFVIHAGAGMVRTKHLGRVGHILFVR